MFVPRDKTNHSQYTTKFLALDYLSNSTQQEGWHPNAIARVLGWIVQAYAHNRKVQA